MNFNEFAMLIRDHLAQKYQVSEMNIRIQWNSEIKIRIILEEGDRLTVSLNKMYQSYLEGKSLNIIKKEAEAIIDKAYHHYKIVKYSLLDYNNVKSRLILRIRNSRQNKRNTNDFVHRSMEDLLITYHMILEEGNGEILISAINNHMLQRYGIAEEQLYQDTVKNCQEKYPAVLYNMIERKEYSLSDHNTDIQYEHMRFSPIFALSIEGGIYGSIAMLYPGILQKIAELLCHSFFILPSSIHELVIIPDTGEEDIKELKNMVEQVNEELVRDDEWLSDQVYYYHMGKQAFGMAVALREDGSESNI